ncbi:MAG: hypothetical protein ACHQDY_08705 [Solirubrobacterales bacterium]
MRTLSIGGALVAVALALVMGLGGVAGAQEVKTDPHAGSPAGVIYQIPLDSGRRDAAPVLPVGSRPSGGSSASESSGTPGAAAGHSASSAESASATPAAGDTPGEPSSIHSENGFGSSSEVPGVSPAAVRIGAGVAAAHTAGSSLPSYLLMALIALAAIGVGLVANRGRGGSR